MRRRHNQRGLGVLSAAKLLGVALAVVLGVFCAAALSSANPQPQSESGKAQLERGRYLVQQIGLCGDCHTPMDDKGQPIESKTLEGARVIFKPTVPMPAWSDFAPPIAGLPGFTEAQAIAFLTTGKDVSGKLAAPPMPRYRFSEKDASAVVAFLRSLKPQK